MNIKTSVSLDLVQNNIPPRFSAKQNDRLTRFVEISLNANGIPFNIPSETVLVLRYKKADGTIGFYDTDENGETAFAINKNIVTTTLAEQILTAAGEVNAELNLYNATGQRLTSFSFIIDVVASAVSDKQITSTSYYNVLSAQIASVLIAESKSLVSAVNAAASEKQAKASALLAVENAQISNSSRTIAETKASEAAEHSSNAFESKAAAVTAATQSEAYAIQAASSRTDANASKISAAKSATDALNSSTKAASSETSAALSAKEAAESAAISKGDMLKSVYDKNNNGSVDNAEKLGNELPSYYKPNMKKIDITIGGDADLYYPVVVDGLEINELGYCKLLINRKYYEKAPDSWHSSTHKGTLQFEAKLHIDGLGGAYTLEKYTIAEMYSTTFCDLRGSNKIHGACVFWLRGGTAAYHIFSENVASTATIYLTTTDLSATIGFTVSPKTYDDVNSSFFPKFAAGGKGDIVCPDMNLKILIPKGELRNVTAETKSQTDNSAAVATTAFVKTQNALVGILPYTHTKTGNIHSINGIGVNIKFTATADFMQGDIFKVNGVVVTVINQNSRPLGNWAFTTGKAVLATLKNTALEIINASAMPYTVWKGTATQGAVIQLSEPIEPFLRNYRVNAPGKIINNCGCWGDCNVAGESEMRAYFVGTQDNATFTISNNRNTLTVRLLAGAYPLTEIQEVF